VARGGPSAPTTCHLLAPCTVCGEPRMVGVTTKRLGGTAPWPSCSMTPGCEGRHVPSRIERSSTCRTRPSTLERRVAATTQLTLDLG
jgi:hypothetical protein